MVTSTFSSGLSGSLGSPRAPRNQRCASWSGSAGQSPVSRPGDNWSRVRDQRLKGQTGQSVLMDRRPGWPARGPASTRWPGRRAADGDMGLARRVRGRTGVVRVVAVQIVVQVEDFINIIVIVVFFIVVLVVEVVEVLVVVEVDLVGLVVLGV